MPDGILADLDDDVVAGLECLFDLATGTAESGGLPVHLTGVEHAVAAAADVDERRLHGGQHVLHDAEIDVADQRCRRRGRDEVLDQHAVLEHRDLGVAGALVRRFGADLVAHHHDAFDGLAAGQELGLAQDRRAAPSCVAAVPAALPLGLQPGGPADALNLVVDGLGRLLARRALVHDRVRRIVRRCGLVPVACAGLAAPAPAATSVATLAGPVLVVGALFIRVVVRVALVGGFVVVAVIVGRVVGVLLTTATSSATAPSPTPTGSCGTVARLIVGVARLIVGVIIVVVFVVIVVFDRDHDGRCGCTERDRLRRDEQRHVRRGLGGGRCRRRLQHQA